MSSKQVAQRCICTEALIQKQESISRQQLDWIFVFAPNLHSAKLFQRNLQQSILLKWLRTGLWRSPSFWPSTCRENLSFTVSKGFWIGDLWSLQFPLLRHNPFFGRKWSLSSVRCLFLVQAGFYVTIKLRLATFWLNRSYWVKCSCQGTVQQVWLVFQ